MTYVTTYLTNKDIYAMLGTPNTKENKMPTLEVRMKTALKAIRQQGIVAKRNVAGCCRGCINLGLADEVPVIWTYGGQGGAVYIEGDWATSDQMYFNHDNLFKDDENGNPVLNDAGTRVMEAFALNGIDASVESPHRCLIVNLGASEGSN